MSNKDSREICGACGTSPVNHHLLLILNLLEETFGRINNKIFNFTNTGIWLKISSAVEKILFNLLSFIGIIRFNTDSKKVVTGRSELIWEEAKRRSIQMEQIIIFNRPIEYYRAKINGKFFYFESLPIPPDLPKNGYLWIDDKFTLFKKLKDANIPAPYTEKPLTINGAKKAFRSMRAPVIVKPKNGSRGRHTTTNIQNESELIKAIKIVRKITLFPVIQEHLVGSVYRATVINNKLVGFYRADPPEVIGDGIRTIRELIEEKNSTRHERLSDILINDDLNFFLSRQSYKINDIPKKGSIVPLSAKTGRMYGGYTKEMLPEIHPKIHSIFEKAGEIVNAPVVGFDLIIEKPAEDPDTQRWGIIECNSLPFIDLHYLPLEGTPINLAKNVWDLWN